MPSALVCASVYKLINNTLLQYQGVKEVVVQVRGPFSPPSTKYTPFLPFSLLIEQTIGLFTYLCPYQWVKCHKDQPPFIILPCLLEGKNYSLRCLPLLHFYFFFSLLAFLFIYFKLNKPFTTFFLTWVGSNSSFFAFFFPSPQPLPSPRVDIVTPAQGDATYKALHF